MKTKFLAAILAMMLSVFSFLQYLQVQSDIQLPCLTVGQILLT